MNTEFWIPFLGYNLAFNYALLLFWALMMLFASNTVYRLHSRWFPISRENFNAIHYAGMAFYKILIFVFCLMPLLALWLMS
ncbi:MAG: DUF6868 family protein [Pseudomonadota bacterium]